MKHGKMVLVVLTSFLALAVGRAYAETVEGEVTNVDLEGKALEVQKTGEAKETVKISVNDSTTYSGEVTALEEVIEGDAAKIEATKDASGNWMATSVDISVEEVAAPAEEAAAPAPVEEKK